MRIFELPLQLCPNSEISIAILVERGNYQATNYQVFLGENLGGGDPTSYSLLGAGSIFAQHGILLSDYNAGGFMIDQRIGFVVRLDGVDTLLEEQTLAAALANKLLCVIDDEIMSVIGWQLIAADTYQVYVIRQRFGTVRAAHLVDADVYFIPIAGIVPLQAPTFQHGNEVAVKVLSLALDRNQDLSDIDPETITLSAAALSLAAPALLTVNGFTVNAPYDSMLALEISWILPAVPPGLDLSRAYTLLEFIEGVDVVHSRTAAWPATEDTAFIYPAPKPATFTLRASIVIETDWETISGQTTTINVIKRSGS